MQTQRVMQLNEAFGHVLRSRRLQRNFSQEYLAELAGLHRNFIGLIERAKTSASVESLEALASALECRASDFMLDAERLIAGYKTDNNKAN